MTCGLIGHKWSSPKIFTLSSHVRRPKTCDAHNMSKMEVFMSLLQPACCTGSRPPSLLATGFYDRHVPVLANFENGIRVLSSRGRVTALCDQLVAESRLPVVVV